MKKKETPFPFARPEHRALATKTHRGAAYPSFAEVCRAGDLRELVQRAAQRVLGPAAIAGAVMAATGCESASEFYGDLIAPPADPIAIAPIEMNEVPQPIALPSTTPAPIEPCPIPEIASSGRPKPPPVTVGPASRPPVVRGRMPLVRPNPAPYALGGDVAAVEP
jgi:hypothetical protein